MLDSAVWEVTREVWGGVLGLVPAGSSPRAAWRGALEASAHVPITGDWRGSLALHCTRTLAESVAAIMFAVETSSVTPSMTVDALGEIANMTAGGVKCHLPGTCRIWPPSERAPAPPDPNAIVTRVTFECNEQPLLVELTLTDSSVSSKAE